MFNRTYPHYNITTTNPGWITPGLVKRYSSVKMKYWTDHWGKGPMFFLTVA